MKKLFAEDLKVVNIGLQGFANNITAAGGQVTNITWAPPAGADAALGWTLANPEVRWKLLTWDAVAADHTRVTFEVRRDGADEVTCIVRVADGNAQDVAYATIVIAPGDDYVQPTYDIRTRAPGRVVDLLGCAAGGAPPVPGPEFPPGTQNPPQPWSTEGQP